MVERVIITGMDSITVTKEMLNSMPKSKYSVSHEADTRPDKVDDQTIPECEPPGSPTDQHNSSTDTVLYWSVEDEKTAARAQEQLK